MKVAVFSLFFLSFVMIFSSGTAHAADDGSMIYVNGSSGSDSNNGYTWLTAKQTIVNATGTVTSGGTVTIANGTYTGTGNVKIAINNNMTITGVDQNGTIIDGGGSSQIFTIASGVTVTIENLTLTNGYAGDGGAIYNEGDLTIKNCQITQNNASYGGGIYNVYASTCTVFDSYLTDNTATNAGGGIYNWSNCTVSCSSVSGNTASCGGGIYNLYNTLSVTDSTISDNTATTDIGGGIYIYSGTLSVTDSYITCNFASWYGGGIFNHDSTLSVTSSIISRNIAYYGGGIGNYGTLNVLMCDFESNQATYGNAIYNMYGDASNRVIQFCRFYDQSAGYEIYADSGTIDAQYNWWGSNKNPISKVYGDVDVNPWLVLDIDASPVFIGKNGSSTITANLWYDSDGNYHNPTSEHIIDDIPVIFYTTNIGIVYSPIFTSNSSAVSTLIPNSVSGTSNICAVLDDQTVQTSVYIDATSPTVTAIDPEDNAVINDTSKIVTVNFSESVQEGSSYDNISITCNGIPVSVVTTLTYNILTIINTEGYSNGTYIINIPKDAVIDSAGNGIDTYTSQFTVDTTPPVVTGVDPVDGAVINDAGKVVTVTFSKDIFEGTAFDDITVSCNGIPLTTITKAINGNILTLTNTTSYIGGTYTVNIPINAVVDETGNALDTSFSSEFTIDTVAPVIISTDPVNGATNVSADKVITVTFSENVVMGTGWIELIDRNTGIAINFTSDISANVLTVTPTSDLAEGWYKVMIHTGSVTDLAGNMLTGKSFSFSVGTSPTITSTSPLDGATDVHVAKTITVTFSEAIRKSRLFWVELVNTTTGDSVAFTSYITGGNMLVIDPTAYLAAGTTYTVKLHTGCVTDQAGNPVAPYVFSFTTRST